MERAFENIDKAIFVGIGKYDVPRINPTDAAIAAQWIPFNHTKSCRDSNGKGVHFFLDDYQFIRCWNQPDRYLSTLKRFSMVCSPDFSMYTDMPMAMQIYNHYRKHWLGAYWQAAGIAVIPTISWSTRESFDWCFDGEPKGSLVAISSVGTQNSKERKRLFMEGYEEMLSRLQPSSILFYGQVPKECKHSIVRVKSFSEEMREALCDGW